MGQNGPNILSWAFRIGGAKKLHNKVQSFLDMQLTDRQTDGWKIIKGRFETD